jgi:hypothetical protein
MIILGEGGVVDVAWSVLKKRQKRRLLRQQKDLKRGKLSIPKDMKKPFETYANILSKSSDFVDSGSRSNNPAASSKVLMHVPPPPPSFPFDSQMWAASLDNAGIFDETWANNVVDILLKESDENLQSPPPSIIRMRDSGPLLAGNGPPPFKNEPRNPAVQFLGDGYRSEMSASTWFTGPVHSQDLATLRSPIRNREKQKRMSVLYEDIKQRGEERRFRAGQQLSAIEAMEWERWRRMEAVETNEIGDNQLRHLQVIQAIKAEEGERRRRVQELVDARNQQAVDAVSNRVQAVDAMEIERDRRIEQMETIDREAHIEQERRRAWAKNIAQAEQRKHQYLFLLRQFSLREKLGQELLVFAHKVEKEKELRRWSQKEALTIVSNEVKRCFGASARTEPFGSWTTQLDLPTSDIDLVIILAENSQEETIQHLVQRMAAALRDKSHHPEVTSVLAVENTSFPLVKLTMAMAPVGHPGLPVVDQSWKHSHHSGGSPVPENLSSSSNPGQSNSFVLENQPHLFQNGGAASSPAVHSDLEDSYRMLVKLMTSPNNQDMSIRDFRGAGGGVLMESLGASIAKLRKEPRKSLPSLDDQQGNRRCREESKSAENSKTLKVEEQRSFLIDIDISFATTKHMGIAESTRLRKHVLPNNPELKTIVLALKRFLSVKGLNNPFTGGLSSHAITLLVLFALQKNKSTSSIFGLIAVDPRSLDPRDIGIPRAGSMETSLGHVFLHLLRFIGKEFKPSMSSIHAVLLSDQEMRVDEHPRQMSKLEDRPVEHSKDHVVIEDVYGNNLARSCFRFYEIQTYFAQAVSSVQQILLESGRNAANFSFFEDEHQVLLVDHCEPSFFCKRT